MRSDERNRVFNILRRNETDLDMTWPVIVIDEGLLLKNHRTDNPVKRLGERHLHLIYVKQCGSDGTEGTSGW